MSILLICDKKPHQLSISHMELSFNLVFSHDLCSNIVVTFNVLDLYPNVPDFKYNINIQVLKRNNIFVITNLKRNPPITKNHYKHFDGIFNVFYIHFSKPT